MRPSSPLRDAVNENAPTTLARIDTRVDPISPKMPDEDEIEYPDSDGQPMAENDFQRWAIMAALDMLSLFFARRPNTYVSGDLLMYYERGNPKKSVAPDVFVVFGAPHRGRLHYKLWEESAPAFVLEVASRTTWKQDRDYKPTLYRRLGVQEYWRFDPTGAFFRPRLQGLGLRNGVYRPVPVRMDGQRRICRCDVLQLELRTDAGIVRFHNPKTGEDLRTLEETEAARVKEAAERAAEAAARRDLERRLEQERAAREGAEAQVAELQALLHSRRTES